MGDDNNGRSVLQPIRAMHPAEVELRADDGGDGQTFFSRFAVYNQWTEINSIFEGRFLERFAPGAFRKTMRDRFKQIRVLLNHGNDPELGDKPIVDLADLRDEQEGPVGEGRLLNGLPELVVDGLRSGVYGASHRFQVIRETIVNEPKKSAHNPEGLQERTVTEAKLFEFGPVTFPAYEGATAGVRSLTDELRRFTMAELMAELKDDSEERGRVLAELVRVTGEVPDLGRYASTEDPDPNVTERVEEEDAPSTADAAPAGGTSAPERREPTTGELYGLGGHQDERPSWAL